MLSNLNAVLTHSQASWVFYGQEITPENEVSNEAKIDALLEIELCYINDTSSEPFLVSSGGIRYFPFRYNRYRRSIENSSFSTITDKDVTDQAIHNEAQLQEFVNNVFLAVDPKNEKVYERSELSSEQALQITCQYTSLYKTSKLGFSKKIKARYLKADITRKRTKDLRGERKILYVMKPDDRAFLVRNINNYQYRYTEFIKLDGFDSALLKYLSSTAKKVCLVIVDYAALSIDPDDTLLLVKNYKTLEYIIVGRFQDA